MEAVGDALCGDAEVLMVTAKFRGTTDRVPVVVAHAPEGSGSPVRAVRHAVAEWFGLGPQDYDRLWLVCRGRRLADGDTIGALLDADEGLTVFAGLTPQTEAPRTIASPSAGDSPDSMMAAMGAFMGDNAEMMAQMLQMDPRMQALMEKEPALRSVFKDPDSLREMMRAMARPGTQQEMLRGQDRMIANVSNMPGGMALLERMHGMMEDAVAADSPKLPNPEALQSKYAAPVATDAPMPNPWQASRAPRRGAPARELSPAAAMGALNLGGASSQLALLEAMGLADHDRSKAALSASGNDLGQAVQALLADGARPQSSAPIEASDAAPHAPPPKTGAGAQDARSHDTCAPRGPALQPRSDVSKSDSDGFEDAWSADEGRE